jgi:hypothetical protein
VWSNDGFLTSETECVYKLMHPRAALRAANKTINAFANWVDACHNYRHEEGDEEPSQPPLDWQLS